MFTHLYPRHRHDSLDHERRLILFSGGPDDQDGKLDEVLDAAESGKLGDEDPEKALESHTAKVDKKLNAIPRTLFDSMPVAGARWLLGKVMLPVTAPLGALHTGITKIPVIGGLVLDVEKDVAWLTGMEMPAWSYEAKFEKIVEKEARRRLEQNGTKLDDTRRWLLRRKEHAENHLLLLHAKKLVLEDLQQMQSMRDRELAEREGWAGGLAEYLGKSNDSISREIINDKSFFSSTFGTLKDKIDSEIASYGKLPDEFEAAKLAQERISKDLQDAKVKPAEIEKAFEQLVKGNRFDLEKLIKAHVRPELQGDLIHWTKKLSQIPGFQLAMGLTSEKADLVPPMEKVQKIFNTPPIKPVLFDFNGRKVEAMYECRRLGKMIFKIRGQGGGKGAFFAMNDKGRVSFREPDGSHGRAQIGEGNNTLLFNYSAAQLTP